MDLLVDAVKAWSAAEASASPFEPVTAPGTKGWIAAVGFLRESLSLHAWQALDVRNCPLIIHPKGGLAITVTSGDSRTGSPDADARPTTKNPKGVVLDNAVRVNGEQLPLNFGPTYAPPVRLKPRAARVAPLTWLLMIFTTPNEIYAELSLPAAMEAGYIVDWHERIVLGTLPRQPPPDFPKLSAGDGEHGPAIDVPVVRR